MQNNIQEILDKNPLIPVVTIDDLNDIESIYLNLKGKNIGCIEITLRTPISREAIMLFKEKYGNEIQVGVGTIIKEEDIQFCIDTAVDFMVTPGLTPSMVQPLNESQIPFICGVCTPSEIIQGMSYGWKYFKFFPATIFGGTAALKTYGATFPEARFCPTGGISQKNYSDFLALENVLSVGGTWLGK